MLSVSVISEDGLLADCLSTALFVAGKEAALERMQREDYQLVIVDTEGNIYYSLLGGEFTAKQSKCSRLSVYRL